MEVSLYDEIQISFTFLVSFIHRVKQGWRDDMKIISREGDSLEYYSLLFQIPLELIQDANPQTKKEKLLSGFEVKIPGFMLQKETEMSMETAGRVYQLPLDALYLVNGVRQSMNSPFLIPVRLIKPLIKTEKFYSSASLQKDLELLSTYYPFMKVETIGHSVLGKDIVEVQFGRGDSVVHYNGSFHANEWITSAVLMKWLNELLLSFTNESSSFLHLYQRVNISIVPMVNPDGVDLVVLGDRAAEGKFNVRHINEGETEYYGWKANIRGVDLNNQFPANWQIEKERKLPKAEAPRDFPGEIFLSEPEAIAMQQLAERRNFSKVIALHTQGKEIYWGYEGHEPEESERIVKEMERQSGYRAVRYVDSHAGYKDWFIQEFKRPGFTVELGKGINPLPLSQMPAIYREAVKILMVGLLL